MTLPASALRSAYNLRGPRRTERISEAFTIYVHSPPFSCLARPPFSHRHLVFSTFQSRNSTRSTLTMSQPQDLPLPAGDDTSHVSTSILGHPPGPSTSPSSPLPSESSTSADPYKLSPALPANAHLCLPFPSPHHPPISLKLPSHLLM